MLLVCVVHVVWSGRVILPLPVPSPCKNVVMVLGTGASFMEGFVLFAEARIIAGTRSGGSCGTNCGELLHLPGPAGAGPGVVGSLGGPFLLVSNRQE